MAGDAGAAFEVDQVVLLAERDVVEHGKAERPDVDRAGANLAAGILAADWATRHASGSACCCGSRSLRRRGGRCRPAWRPSPRGAGGLLPCARRVRRRSWPGRSTCSRRWPAARVLRPRPAACAAASRARRNAQTSTFTPRRSQFCWTSSGFSRMKRRSSMGGRSRESGVRIRREVRQGVWRVRTRGVRWRGFRVGSRRGKTFRWGCGYCRRFGPSPTRARRRRARGRRC